MQKQHIPETLFLKLLIRDEGIHYPPTYRLDENNVLMCISLSHKEDYEGYIYTHNADSCFSDISTTVATIRTSASRLKGPDPIICKLHLKHADEPDFVGLFDRKPSRLSLCFR